MSFPTSPANNQTALVNGVSYVYNQTKGAWLRLKSTTQANLVSNTVTVLDSILFSDGTTQTTAGVAVDSYARTTANSATTLAQAAFDSANVISGVNTTQNTNITAVNTYAASAYAAANTKFNTSGGTITGDTVVTGNLTVTGTQFYANTVNMTVEDNIITLNSNVTGAPTLSAGIEVNRGSSTNTKLLWSEANSAWEFTNNGTTYDRIPSQVYANAAYTAANTNATNIGYVNTYAASAYASSNTNATNISVIQGVDNTQNTNITAVNTYAASAYGAANTNGTNITAVNTYAASAYTQANTNASNITIIQGVDATQNTNITTVTTLAQAAFDKANTGSSGSSVLTSTVDTFTGNGSNTAFTLTVEPTNINYTTAVVGGVSQPRSAYSVVGTTLTFTSAPANGQIVEVTTLTTSNSTLYTVNNILSPFLLMGA